jgi:hypothetical protein
MPKNGIEIIINDFLHEDLLPIIQSLNDHIPLAYNKSFHISPDLLKNILHRLTKLRQDLLDLVEEEVK